LTEVLLFAGFLVLARVVPDAFADFRAFALVAPEMALFSGLIGGDLDLDPAQKLKRIGKIERTGGSFLK